MGAQAQVCVYDDTTTACTPVHGLSGEDLAAIGPTVCSDLDTQCALAISVSNTEEACLTVEGCAYIGGNQCIDPTSTTVADCTEQYLLPLAILTYCGAASGQGEDICTAVFGGCTDAECSNYDNSVVWDDGSCVNAAWEDFDVAL